MKKSILLISALAFACFAQTDLNWTGYGDTLAVLGFKADSLKFTSALKWANNEQKAILLQVSDTSIANNGSDSVQFAYGYQLGYPAVPFGSTTAVTRWTQSTFIDSFVIKNGTKFVNPTLNTGVVQLLDTTAHTYTAVDAWGYVDTLSSTTSTMQFHSISTPWAPYIRFWAKGGTGNSKNKFLRVRVTVYQRQFQNTRNK
jgi:hypothetical protein